MGKPSVSELGKYLSRASAEISTSQKGRRKAAFFELVEKPIPVIPRSEATWESVILMLQIYINKAEIACFGNGLPRQSADWLAMTDFFDSLQKGRRKAAFFLVQI